MNTLIWKLRRIARCIGAAGVAGLACLVAAVALAAIATLPARTQLAEQTRQLTELRAHAAARMSAPPLVESPRLPLADLPPTAAAAEQIGMIERLARVHGISLTRGQYSATPQAGTTLTRWQIVLPVEASYPAVHAWLATVLERLPNLALDELKLKRERIESATLQAELRMSLYMESTP
ncbi:MAG: GspMb/PilO family protein [Thiobacillus sp.]